MEVLSSRSGNVNIVRVNGDVVMERGEEKGVEQFLSNARRSRRHCVLGGLDFDNSLLITDGVRVFVRAYLGDSCRSQRLGQEQTSPTPEPKNLLKGENPSIVRGTVNSCAFHGSET